jgi:tetratricopeptide (TPR) repeat protein
MLSFGWREGLSGPQASALFERARDQLRATGDRGREAMLHSSYGRVLGTIENSEAYLEHAMEALRLAREANSEPLEIVAGSTACQALRHAGQLREGLELIDQLLERAARSERTSPRLGFSPRLWLRGQRAQTLIFLGRLGEAESDLAYLDTHSTDWNQADLIDQARRAWVDLHWLRADAPAALAEASQLARLVEVRGSPYAQVGACQALGLAYLLNARFGDAVQALETAVSRMGELRVSMELEALILAYLAEAQQLGGDVDLAEETTQRAERVAQQRRTRVFDCYAKLVRGRIRLRRARPGDLEGAELALAAALELCAQTGARTLEPFVRVELAELASRHGNASTRVRERRRARALFREIGAPARAAALER